MPGGPVSKRDCQHRISVDVGNLNRTVGQIAAMRGHLHQMVPCADRFISCRIKVWQVHPHPIPFNVVALSKVKIVTL